MSLPAFERYLAECNEEQRAGAAFSGKKAAILGSPGAGKTRCVIALIASLVDKGIDPAKILAMTFTRSAANEMNERLQMLGITGARVGTIHSVANQILRETVPGLVSTLTVDSDRVIREIKFLLSDMRKERIIYNSEGLVDDVAHYVAEVKALGVGRISCDPFATETLLERPLQEVTARWSRNCNMRTPALLSLYTELDARRTARGWFDFDDMIMWTWQLLLNPLQREHWKNRWNYIVIDEHQDSSPVQWDIARRLAGLDSTILASHGKTSRDGFTRFTLPADVIQEHELYDLPEEQQNSLIISGDSAQSIYGFRHGDLNAFLAWVKRPDVQVFRLPKNYRSVPEVCALGNTIATDKRWNTVGSMQPIRESRTGELPVQIRTFKDPREEIVAAVDWASARYLEAPIDGTYVAILSRTRGPLLRAEIELIKRGVRYVKLIHGQSLYETKEMKDLLAYLHVICAMDPDSTNFRRIINTPFRFISTGFIEKCQQTAAMRSIPLFDSVVNNREEISERPRKSLMSLVSLIRGLNAKAAAGARPAELLQRIINDTGYIEYLRKDEGLGDSDQRIEIIQEIIRIAGPMATCVEFFQHVNEQIELLRYGRDRDKRGTGQRGGVLLSTIHGFKGLEATHVWLLDVSTGRFPSELAEDPEEENRLFYVAATRARQTLILSSAGVLSAADGSVKLYDLPTFLGQAATGGAILMQVVTSAAPSGACPTSPAGLLPLPNATETVPT